MNRLIFKMLLILVILPAPVFAQTQGENWPRTFPLQQGSITIYAPQVDEFDGKLIKFRAALAYREKADSDPVFGAGWFESPVKADRSGRAVRPTDIEVTELRFPEGTGDLQADLAKAVARESSTGRFDLSMSEIDASLKQTEAESLALENLNTDPPLIIYKDHPALLVSLDGEPVTREIENSPYSAVINTPYPLITDGRYYYLNVARDVWYRARKATGPYRFEENPPADIVALVDDEEKSPERTETEITAENAPEIVVSTEPAELLVTEGPAAFVPLVDDLLVLQNSDDDVFMHVSEQKFYIVLAGRWYESGSLDGPWAYRPSDDLPPAFANIPQTSSQADSRVYVAGTQEANEAVLDAQVPQTAAVARGEVDIDVQYDGDPAFEDVDGADLTYASNTGSTVILANGMYYLVEDGVWYVSSTPDGPWLVSDHRPPQVVSIQPTSPVYNVRYVYVYDSTPDVVYVGYTPGYLGSYVHHNTLFYGSGWYYDPWVSPYYYYPRHGTWGFNVSYNSWSGWNFGLSWGWGPFSFGWYSGGYWHHHHHWHHRHYGRWGPGRYRARPYHRGPYRHHRPRAERYANRNLYRDGRQRARVAGTRDVMPRVVDQKGRVYDKHSSRGGRYGEPGKAGTRRSSVKTVSKQEIRSKASLAQTRNKKTTGNKSLLATGKRGQVKQVSKRSVVRNKPQVVQRQGKSQVAKRQSKPQVVRKQSKPQVVQRQSKQQMVRRQSKPQVVQRQSKSHVVRSQNKPQVVQKQRSAAPAKQASRKSTGKSYASRQVSKGGQNRVAKASNRRHGRK